MLRFFFLCILTTFFSSVGAQSYKLTGRVTNRHLEPLPFASIQVKGQNQGVQSREDGSYGLQLEEGQYTIVFSLIGYETQSITLVINKDQSQNVILEEDRKSLEEVVVKAKDRATEIIRQVILHKEGIQAASGAYTCQVYIKAVQEDSSQYAATSKKRVRDTSRINKSSYDLTRMAMAEVSLRLDFEDEKHQKEERLGVKRRGNSSELFYLSTIEGNFDFYNNLLRVSSLSVMPFVSPISYSGLLAYRFKTLRVEQRGTHKLYTIAIKPRKLSSATVEGEVTITDSSWAIIHTRLQLPAYHLPEYDFFEVEQDYAAISGKAWLLNRQAFTYYTKSGKKKLSGRTIVNYTNYELNKVFVKKYFDTEISATALEAYKKDSSFWTTARQEPLTEKEVRFIRYSDSIYRVTHSKPYLDSIDRLTNKVTWKKVAFLGQPLYNREKERT